jgi:hypothetical protein
MVAIRRIQLIHAIHYLMQALLMAGLVLSTERGIRAAGPAPSFTPYIILTVLLLIPITVGLYSVARYMRPNLRRPIAENQRVYTGRVVLRNSVLGLLSLPPLLFYRASHNWTDLLLFVLLLIGLCALTWPTARRYQRWLIT